MKDFNDFLKHVNKVKLKRTKINPIEMRSIIKHDNEFLATNKLNDLINKMEKNNDYNSIQLIKLYHEWLNS